MPVAALARSAPLPVPASPWPVPSGRVAFPATASPRNSPQVIHRKEREDRKEGSLRRPQGGAIRLDKRLRRRVVATSVLPLRRGSNPATTGLPSQ